MTGRERVLAALRHEDTGFVPYHLECTTQEHERVARFLGDESFEENVSCLCGWQYWGFPEERADKPEHFTDDFGVNRGFLPGFAQSGLMLGFARLNVPFGKTAINVRRFN